MANNERERKAPVKGTHSAPSRRREGAKKAAPARKAGAGHRGMLLAGWGFLGAVILLAAAVLIRLIPEREGAPAIVPTAAPGPAGSAFTVQAEQPLPVFFEFLRKTGHLEPFFDELEGSPSAGSAPSTCPI